MLLKRRIEAINCNRHLLTWLAVCSAKLLLDIPLRLVQQRTEVICYSWRICVCFRHHRVWILSDSGFMKEASDLLSVTSLHSIEYEVNWNLSSFSAEVGAVQEGSDLLQRMTSEWKIVPDASTYEYVVTVGDVCMYLNVRVSCCGMWFSHSNCFKVRVHYYGMCAFHVFQGASTLLWYVISAFQVLWHASTPLEKLHYYSQWHLISLMSFDVRFDPSSIRFLKAGERYQTDGLSRTSQPSLG